MPAERRASYAGLLCLTVAVAAALMAGGCSMGMPSRMGRFAPPAGAVPDKKVAFPEVPSFDSAIDLVSKLKYPQAEIEFRRSLVWVQAAGDKDRSAECLFWIGFCQEKQGRSAEARVQYDKVIRDYPGTPAGRMAAVRRDGLPAAPAPAPNRGS